MQSNSVTFNQQYMKTNTPSSVSVDEDVSLTFPQKLMELLEDHSHDHIVSWLDHGMAFMIYDKTAFLKEVLPRFFKRKSGASAKFLSFVRKLNRWGFVRISMPTLSNHDNSENPAYAHPHFQRGKHKLLARMSCSAGAGQHQSSPSTAAKKTILRSIRTTTSSPVLSGPALDPSSPLQSLPPSSSALSHLQAFSATRGLGPDLLAMGTAARGVRVSSSRASPTAGLERVLVPVSPSSTAVSTTTAAGLFSLPANNLNSSSSRLSLLHQGLQIEQNHVLRELQQLQHKRRELSLLAAINGTASMMTMGQQDKNLLLPPRADFSGQQEPLLAASNEAILLSLLQSRRTATALAPAIVGGVHANQDPRLGLMKTATAATDPSPTAGNLSQRSAKLPSVAAVLPSPVHSSSSGSCISQDSLLGDLALMKHQTANSLTTGQLLSQQRRTTKTASVEKECSSSSLQTFF